MKKLDSNKISRLSNDMFEYILVNHIDPDSIAARAGVNVNDVLRLQSENPFVSEESFRKVRTYITSALSNDDNRQSDINAVTLNLFDYRSEGAVKLRSVMNEQYDSDSQSVTNLLFSYLLSNNRNNYGNGQSYSTNINLHQKSSEEKIGSQQMQIAYV
ncbi:hypothetical protein EFT43_07865 [Leuconostoc falkenbergense]|uniref:hypothetical protein n=1 Tax=Leuconostoc falkenbergense TaxID=2766470 RepID=UPI0021A9954C|nr:hypothetical protein [Leuconostoc falkenbergense]MCT4404813.1 hypothetical protein [Leuconostoc falkenbergense]